MLALTCGLCPPVSSRVLSSSDQAGASSSGVPSAGPHSDPAAAVHPRRADWWAVHRYVSTVPTPPRLAFAFALACASPGVAWLFPLPAAYVWSVCTCILTTQATDSLTHRLPLFGLMTCATHTSTQDAEGTLACCRRQPSRRSDRVCYAPTTHASQRCSNPAPKPPPSLSFFLALRCAAPCSSAVLGSHCPNRFVGAIGYTQRATGVRSSAPAEPVHFQTLDI